MPYTKRQRQQKGFTLIELLIVILLVSSVYFLAFSDIEMTKKKPKALTPLNLKQTIMDSELFKGRLTLLCVDKCKTCLLRHSIASPYQPYNNSIDLTDIKAYTIDSRDSLVQIEYERYNDKKICLQMDFYPNGSSTKIILENEEGAYFLPAYFEEPKQFPSVEDAKEYWMNNTQQVADEGAFY